MWLKSSFQANIHTYILLLVARSTLGMRSKKVIVFYLRAKNGKGQAECLSYKYSFGA